MSTRTVFFVSDGTAITAETFGTAILSQFETEFQIVRMPFMDSPEKTLQSVEEINQNFKRTMLRPIAFTTLANPDMLSLFQFHCEAKILDLFGTFLHPLEVELGLKSLHRVGRFHDVRHNQSYQDRINAINFSLNHDDGQSDRDLASADVILVGVSRSGKTPTSLYLAMQFGLKAANYPLIPEDFERQQLPSALAPYRHKLFGLTICPRRLSEIRSERRPNSRYASLENCFMEVQAAEAMMRRSGIRSLSTTTKSIEEIATTILQQIHPDKQIHYT